jgi:hypothetical protein
MKGPWAVLAVLGLISAFSAVALAAIYAPLVWVLVACGAGSAVTGVLVADGYLRLARARNERLVRLVNAVVLSYDAGLVSLRLDGLRAILRNPDVDAAYERAKAKSEETWNGHSTR